MDALCRESVFRLFVIDVGPGGLLGDESGHGSYQGEV